MLATFLNKTCHEIRDTTLLHSGKAVAFQLSSLWNTPAGAAYPRGIIRKERIRVKVKDIACR